MIEKLGRIQFSVGYSFQDSTLTVKILKGQDLPAKDFSGTSDPFVKLYLLPDKKHKLETKVKRKNLNPHWNETFLFEGSALLQSTKHTINIDISFLSITQSTNLSKFIYIALYNIQNEGQSALHKNKSKQRQRDR